MKFQITETSSCSKQAAEMAITKAIQANLAKGTDYAQSNIDVALDLVLSEGHEQCGHGSLEIAGSAKVRLSKKVSYQNLRDQWEHQTHRYSLHNAGSRWENYGTPSGTRYALALVLEEQ